MEILVSGWSGWSEVAITEVPGSGSWREGKMDSMLQPLRRNRVEREA